MREMMEERAMRVGPAADGGDPIRNAGKFPTDPQPEMYRDPIEAKLTPLSGDRGECPLPPWLLAAVDTLCQRSKVYERRLNTLENHLESPITQLSNGQVPPALEASIAALVARAQDRLEVYCEALCHEHFNALEQQILRILPQNHVGIGAPLPGVAEEDEVAEDLEQSMLTDDRSRAPRSSSDSFVSAVMMSSPVTNSDERSSLPRSQSPTCTAIFANMQDMPADTETSSLPEDAEGRSLSPETKHIFPDAGTDLSNPSGLQAKVSSNHRAGRLPMRTPISSDIGATPPVPPLAPATPSWFAPAPGALSVASQSTSPDSHADQPNQADRSKVLAGCQLSGAPPGGVAGSSQSSCAYQTPNGSFGNARSQCSTMVHSVSVDVLPPAGDRPAAVLATGGIMSIRRISGSGGSSNCSDSDRPGARMLSAITSPVPFGHTTSSGSSRSRPQVSARSSSPTCCVLSGPSKVTPPNAYTHLAVAPWKVSASQFSARAISPLQSNRNGSVNWLRNVPFGAGLDKGVAPLCSTLPAMSFGLVHPTLAPAPLPCNTSCDRFSSRQFHSLSPPPLRRAGKETNSQSWTSEQDEPITHL